MAKRQDLGMQCCSSAETVAKGREQRDNDREHVSGKLSLQADKFNRINRY